MTGFSVQGPIDGSSRSARRRGVLISLAVTTPLALLTLGTLWSGIVLSCVAMSAAAGWRLGPAAVVSQGWRAILAPAIAWAAFVSVGGLAIALIGSIVVSALEPSTATAETPLGYFLLVAIGVASLTPVVVVPASLVGFAWVLLVRKLRPGVRSI